MRESLSAGLADAALCSIAHISAYAKTSQAALRVCHDSEGIHHVPIVGLGKSYPKVILVLITELRKDNTTNYLRGRIPHAKKVRPCYEMLTPRKDTRLK